MRAALVLLIAGTAAALGLDHPIAPLLGGILWLGGVGFALDYLYPGVDIVPPPDDRGEP